MLDPKKQYPDINGWLSAFKKAGISKRTAMIMPWACSVGIVLFAFIMSQQNGEASRELSSMLTTWLYGFAYEIVDYIPNLDGRNLFFMLEYSLRKSMHFFMFLFLAFSLVIALRSFFKQKRFAFIYAFILTLGAACLDEFHQLFIPGRTASLADVALDMAGAMCGMYVLLIGLLIRYIWRWFSLAWTT